MGKKQKTTPLRAAREARGESLRKVAEAVQSTRSNLSRIELGEQRASLELAERLAKHFGHTVTEMQILYPERYMQTALPRG